MAPKEPPPSPPATPPPATPVDTRPKVLVGQLAILLEAIEEDSTLFNSQNSDLISVMNVDKWLALTDKLNKFPKGAQIPVASWKYVLRYWSVNTKKKRNLDKRMVTRAQSSSLTIEEARELAQLENRFYRFIMREESQEEQFDENDLLQDKPVYRSAEFIPENLKLVVEVINVTPEEDTENTAPEASKRAIEIENGSLGPPKKIKLIFDNVFGDATPSCVVINKNNTYQKLQIVSRELEEKISTIQNRIHMIKDLWKHRCGDN